MFDADLSAFTHFDDGVYVAADGNASNIIAVKKLPVRLVYQMHYKKRIENLNLLHDQNAYTVYLNSLELKK